MCFVLVLGSLVPCLPAFSSGSKTVKEDPIAADSVYAASQSKYLANSGERSHVRCTGAPLILALWRQRQGELYEFETSPVYMRSSRPGIH